MQCKDWEHNRVNAGMIKTIKSAFPTEKIKLYAEEKHIVELNKINEKEGIQVESVSINFADWRQNSQDSQGKYAKLLNDIILQEPEGREIILLSSNKGIVLACDRVFKKYPDRTCHVILHAAAEEIVHYQRRTLKDIAEEFVSDIYHRRLPSKQPISMKECMEKCTTRNCKFIIYSPNYRKGLQGKLSDNIIEKMTFLHHPFFNSGLTHTNEGNDKIKIGIYGQAVNQNAVKIVKTYNLYYDNDSILFQVMAKNDHELLAMRNVKRLFEEDYVSNETLEYAINSFDYILVPYSSEQYVVTASGIFCDAVSQGRPLLMLNSPYFEYYNKYNIGFMEDSIDAMARKIAELNQVKINVFSSNEINLKQLLFDENVETLKKVLDI